MRRTRQRVEMELAEAFAMTSHSFRALGLLEKDGGWEIGRQRQKLEKARGKPRQPVAEVRPDWQLLRLLSASSASHAVPAKNRPLPSTHINRPRGA